MIARIWHGYTLPEHADDYEAYGRWAAEVPAPQPDGQPSDNVTLSGIATIPGTASLWAVGSTAQPESTPNGMIETYGP